MGKSSCYPGFRFSPTAVELVMFYLKKKLLGEKLLFDFIAEVKIYDFSPWDLPAKSKLQNGDLKWYFFCSKSKKYLSGSRMNRATEAGFWKSTGKDREVKYKEKTVAKIKTLVFHLGHPPKGERTNWVMHEYRMEDKDLANDGVVQEAYVLCKLFKKSGAGPKNGEEYGAPFEEEDYDIDEAGGSESSAMFNMCGVTEILNPKASSSALTNMTSSEPGAPTVTSSGHVETSSVMSTALVAPSAAAKALNPGTRNPSKTKMTSFEPGPSTITSSENEIHVDVPANDDAMLTHEDIASIFHNNNAKEIEDLKGKKVVTTKDDDCIFKDLDFLSNLDAFGMDYTLDAFLSHDDLDLDLGKFFVG